MTLLSVHCCQLNTCLHVCATKLAKSDIKYLTFIPLNHNNDISCCYSKCYFMHCRKQTMLLAKLICTLSYQWFTTFLAPCTQLSYVRLSNSKDAFKIAWDVMQWNILLFTIKVCHIDHPSYVLHGIWHQYMADIWTWLDNDYSAKKLRRVLEILCGAFKRCSRVRLYLCRKWTDLDEIWGTVSILFGAGPDRFWARSVQKRERETLRKLFFCQINNA